METWRASARPAFPLLSLDRVTFQHPPLTRVEPQHRQSVLVQYVIQRLREDISYILLPRNSRHVNDSLVDAVADEVTSDVDVFHASVVFWVVEYSKGRLVINEERRGSFNLHAKFAEE